MADQPEIAVNISDAILLGDVVVSKDPSVLVIAYRAALQRFRDAVATGTDQEVFAALVETIQWVTGLAHDGYLDCDDDVRGLEFARDRAHHQLASVTDGMRPQPNWRPSALLPASPNPKHQGGAKRGCYDKQLAGQPVFDVFQRLSSRL